MRLDAYLYSENKYGSRTKAAEAVEKGNVTVNGKTVFKPSYDVKPTDSVEIVKPEDFVSNGGYKLEKAIDDFGIDVSGDTFADIGASTGGFTDCLLQRGAEKVYAVDVGESQLSEKLKNDERVVVIDNFNARELTPEVLGGQTDGAVCDVSFISLTYILKPIYDILKPEGYAVVLLKPQFECGKKELNKNGIVTSVKAKTDCAVKIKNYALSLGFAVTGFTFSPIKVGKNIEYLFYLKKGFEKIGSVTDKYITETIVNSTTGSKK